MWFKEGGIVPRSAAVKIILEAMNIKRISMFLECVAALLI